MRIRVVGAVAAAVLTVVMFGPVASARQVSSIHRGGVFNYVQGNGDTWVTLDPTASTGSLNTSAMDAIYGRLFSRSASGQIVPDIALGWTLSDHNLTVTIPIRPGVKFSDGTPLNAAAVAWSINRNLQPQYACPCLADFASVKSVTAGPKNSVVLHLSSPDGALQQAFVAEGPDWTIDPTAYNSMGVTAYDQMPVGAGPFKVVSNVASSQLVLTKNPNYWEKGHPYLSGVTFTSASVDQSAYAALEAGTVTYFAYVSTPSIVTQGEQAHQAIVRPGLLNNIVELNSYSQAPFNNITAREAISYATNAGLIQQAVSPGFGQPDQAPVGPGSSAYEKQVPGFPKYDPAKAQSLVQQLGGLSFTLQEQNSPIPEEIGAALQNMWSAVGIKVTLDPLSNTVINSNMLNGSFQAVIQASGSIDPDVGTSGLSIRFGSTGTQSGTRDPQLDHLIAQSQQFVNPATRLKIFHQIYAYIAQQYLAVELFSTPIVVLTQPNLVPLIKPDLSLSTGKFPIIALENVWLP